jgi:hypothetical protein
VDEPPVLDGAVRDEQRWQSATPLTTFWQTTPNEGVPVSESTEVRILYTKEALYFGVICFDRDPGRMVVADARRDSSLDDTDSFQIILDTYLDRQNGFVFGTSPSGLEYDGQVAREGEEGDTSGQSAGAGGGFNINWDASWTVRTSTGDFGWSAEFEIPFRTLRYARGGAQVWGLNLQRNIRRHKESAFWSRLPRQYGLFRVSAAGVLRGIDVPGQKNLKVSPYVLARTERAAGEDDADAQVGGDLKWSVTPSLTLDATVNTDFAQVEVDEQQINLDRFNLFFPEKRPFFLENAGTFTAGAAGEVELFFSRRIGIGPAGEVVPIVAGGRLSGRVAGATVGLLNMQTEAVAGVAPANNFTVARLGAELPNRSGVGAIVVNRQATGDLAGDDDWNRTFGVDGRVGFARYGQVAGFLAKTSTPGVSENDVAFQLGANWSSPGWWLFGKYSEVGEEFNPEVGFLRRQGYRKPEVLVFRRKRMNGWLGLHEIRPHASYEGYFKPDGFHESGFLHLDNHFEWKSGFELHTGVNVTEEGLREPFEIVPGIFVPPGTYQHAEAQLVVITNQGAPISLDTTTTLGGFFGGSRWGLEAVVRARASQAFRADLRWERNDVDLPGGRFVTNLASARVSWSFTPRLFAQALLQHNDRADLWSANLRFGWLQTANTGLFVVYTESSDTGALADDRRDRSLVVKFSRLFDLLD